MLKNTGRNFFIYPPGYFIYFLNGRALSGITQIVKHYLTDIIISPDTA